jgi:acetoacetyl-CoA synthetase
MTPATDPRPQISLYQEWLGQTLGKQFENYAALHRWSVTDLDGFWQSIWDYFDLHSPTPHSRVCDGAPMPNTRWFIGAKFNYAAQVFRHADAAHAAGMPAIVSMDEARMAKALVEPTAPDAQPVALSWPQLRHQSAALALHLREQGVQAGDRVAALLPNTPATTVAFLAVISIGAVWSVCSPDMGASSVLDRFRQIDPKVLIATDTIRYNGQVQNKREVLEQLVSGLPSLQQVIWVPGAQADLNAPAALQALHPHTAFLESILQCPPERTTGFQPEALPFDHPLWIVYSSGTTGLPKPIVHGHGGIVVVALALKCLHNDVGCSYQTNTWGERFFWYSTTGWVMWNAQMSGLLSGTTICLFDGNPGGTKERPDWGTLWRFASLCKATYFGAGAAFYANCQKAGLDLRTCGDLHRIRALGSTGSPLGELAQQWGTDAFATLGRSNIWWCNISGGTDFAGAFIGGNRALPATPGAMQCRLLGCAVQAWNEQGQAVQDQVGELVCTQPIPSMPLYFWGDTGKARYLSSYFDMYPGVWRHGDWLKIQGDGSCIIYGRSDATINRHGLRLGTSELYNAIESLPEVLDSMVVDLEFLGRESYMPLFVVLRKDLVLDAALEDKIRAGIRHGVSPRFLPDAIFQVEQIPRTLTGKKQELPIKKLFLGAPLEKVINKEAMVNPECLDWYQQFATRHFKGPAAL